MNSTYAERYNNQTIIDHLAHQYVLGLLSLTVQQRTEKLSIANQLLADKIIYWQQQFSCFDKQTDELQPQLQTWQNITNTITQIEQDENEKQQSKSLTSKVLPFKLISILCLIVILLLGYLIVKSSTSNNELRYISLLVNPNQQVQLVISAPKNSQHLTIQVNNLPNIAKDQAIELWIIDKTTGNSQSLGLIPDSKNSIQKSLLTTQWQLLANAKEAIVTIENMGGSINGKPSKNIIARGVFVTLH